MAIRAGQQVECIDASTPFFARFIRWIFRMGWPLIKGNMYTVQGLPFLLNEPAIVLVEVKNTSLLDGAFRRARFRPVVEHKTDIGFAHEILRKTTRKNQVRA